MPRRLVIMNVAGLVAAGSLAVGLAVAGRVALGAFVFAVACLGILVPVLFAKGGRRVDGLGVSARRGEVTGRRLWPRQSQPLPPPWEQSWTGGGNVATDMGRMDATWPLAVLAVHGQTLTLRFRLSLLTRLVGVGRQIVWAPGEVITVHPVRGRILSFNRGVAIESTTTPLAYFWTTRPEAILVDLAARGLPVDWAERFIRLWR